MGKCYRKRGRGTRYQVLSGPSDTSFVFGRFPGARRRAAAPLLLPFLLSSLPALAVTFQTRLESVEWKVEGDQFECRPSQPVANFGVGEFVRRAGEQATFRLKPEAQWLGRGSATLLAAAPPLATGAGRHQPWPGQHR